MSLPEPDRKPLVSVEYFVATRRQAMQVSDQSFELPSRTNVRWNLQWNDIHHLESLGLSVANHAKLKLVAMVIINTEGAHLPPLLNKFPWPLPNWTPYPWFRFIKLMRRVH